MAAAAFLGGSGRLKVWCGNIARPTWPKLLSLYYASLNSVCEIPRQFIAFVFRARGWCCPVASPELGRGVVVPPRLAVVGRRAASSLPDRHARAQHIVRELRRSHALDVCFRPRDGSDHSRNPSSSPSVKRLRLRSRSARVGQDSSAAALWSEVRCGPLPDLPPMPKDDKDCAAPSVCKDHGGDLFR